MNRKKAAINKLVSLVQWFGAGFDISFYGLKMLSWTGIIWDLKPVPLAAHENPHSIQ